jgi:C4-type Zn-finger protein
MAVVGMLLTVCGTGLVAAALRAMRAELCPGCGAFGTLVGERRVLVEQPGFRELLETTRRCSECGAAVREQGVAGAGMERVRRVRWAVAWR